MPKLSVQDTEHSATQSGLAGANEDGKATCLDHVEENGSKTLWEGHEKHALERTMELGRWGLGGFG